MYIVYSFKAQIEAKHWYKNNTYFILTRLHLGRRGLPEFRKEHHTNLHKYATITY